MNLQAGLSPECQVQVRAKNILFSKCIHGLVQPCLLSELVRFIERVFPKLDELRKTTFTYIRSVWRI